MMALARTTRVATPLVLLVLLCACLCLCAPLVAASVSSSTGAASIDTTLVWQVYTSSSCTGESANTMFVSSINGGCGLYPRSTAAYEKVLCQNSTGTTISLSVRDMASNMRMSQTSN